MIPLSGALADDCELATVYVYLFHYDYDHVA